MNELTRVREARIAEEARLRAKTRLANLFPEVYRRLAREAHSEITQEVRDAARLSASA